MSRRLLLLNTDLEIGGTPTVVRELAVRLHAPDQGVEVEVACLAPMGPVGRQIGDRGIAVSALNADDFFDLPAVVRRLVGLVHRQRIDTVLSFLVHANTVAAVAGRFCRDVRFVQSIQTTQPRPRWHWWMQSIVHHAAAAVVVPSPSAARVAEERAGIPADKIVIIPNAVDVDAFRAPHRERRGGDPFEIAFVGRFDPVKRIPDLIHAVARLERRKVRLTCYGDGAMRAELAELIGRLGLGGRVSLRGFTPAAEALAASDLLVLPSEAEGFGLVLIEAMAAGVPIVATDAPGIRDVVRHEETGLLVPVGHVDALAAALARCMDDEPLRRRLRDRGQMEVRDKYTWERIIPQYHRLLGLDSPFIADCQLPIAD